MKNLLRSAVLGLALLLTTAIPTFAQITVPTYVEEATGNTKQGIGVSVLTPSGATTTTQTSATVTTGGTFQAAIASSTTRKGCTIQNTSALAEPLFVYFGAIGSATTANSFSLASGASIQCATASLAVITSAVNVTAATTTHAFVIGVQ